MKTYKTELLDLRNMDCMELMAQYPDKYFELAIVDPEYGIKLKGPCGHFQQYGGIQSVNSNPPNEKYFEELFRVSVNQIVWGGNYFILPVSRCWIVWDKGETMYGRSFAECELAWTSFEDVARILKKSSIQKFRVHPTQKPVALYLWLLSNYAHKGDNILDTHMGSGSIAVACHYAGYSLTACELDQEYFDAAIERIKRETAQLTLEI